MTTVAVEPFFVMTSEESMATLVATTIVLVLDRVIVSMDVEAIMVVLLGTVTVLVEEIVVIRDDFVAVQEFVGVVLFMDGFMLLVRGEVPVVEVVVAVAVSLLEKLVVITDGTAVVFTTPDVVVAGIGVTVPVTVTSVWMKDRLTVSVRLVVVINVSVVFKLDRAGLKLAETTEVSFSREVVEAETNPGTVLLSVSTVDSVVTGGPTVIVGSLP